MSGICLGLALTAAQVTLPAEAIELSWSHSVQKVRWAEHYRVEHGRLRLTEASIEGSGAGMEPPEDAVFDGRVWRYRPSLAPMTAITLTRSSYTSDYSLCWQSQCRTLTQLLGPPRQEGDTVLMFACP